MGSAISHQLIREGEIQGYRNGWNRSGKERLCCAGVNATGKPVLIRPSVARARLAELMVSLPPCLIGMEAVVEPTAFRTWASLNKLPTGLDVPTVGSFKLPFTRNI